MHESPITLTIHGVQLTATLAVLGVILNQHKVWVRLKDRLDSLWQDYCHEHGIPYKSLENGGKE